MPNSEHGNSHRNKLWPRGPARGLFRRLLLINGGLFAAGTLVLALSPATVSAPILLAEIPVLTIGLAAIVAANALLVRTSLSPLDDLEMLRQRVDLLRTGERLTDRGAGDLTHLIDTFNAMIDRLEAERSTATARTLAAQEGERERIARELHDEIGQQLTVALLGLRHVIDRAPDELAGELQATQESIRDCLDDVGQVARRLRPGVLKDLGLHSALSSLSNEFSKVSGIPVTRKIDTDLPEFGDAELVIYRIAQESFTNIARHAHAAHAELSLTVEPDQVLLRIADDGRGGYTSEGAGITGMRERALLVGAQLVISSPPEMGTEVRLLIPAEPW